MKPLQELQSEIAKLFQAAKSGDLAVRENLRLQEQIKALQNRVNQLVKDKTALESKNQSLEARNSALVDRTTQAEQRLRELSAVVEASL